MKMYCCRLVPVVLSSLLFALLCEGVSRAESPSPEGQVLRHVVLFKFKDGVGEDKIAEAIKAFEGLPKKIKEIQAFEWGTDVSVENRSEGFTHCFLVTFRDAKGRDTYLPHPAHQELVKLVGPLIDKVLVFDYVAKR